MLKFTKATLASYLFKVWE